MLAVIHIRDDSSTNNSHLAETVWELGEHLLALSVCRRIY
jgi:hypothetical protein